MLYCLLLPSYLVYYSVEVMRAFLVYLRYLWILYIVTLFINLILLLLLESMSDLILLGLLLSFGLIRYRIPINISVYPRISPLLFIRFLVYIS